MPIVYSKDGTGQWWGAWSGPSGKWRAKAEEYACACDQCSVIFPRLPWLVNRSKRGPFCSRACSTAQISKEDRPVGSMRGPASRRWKGGRNVRKDGYVSLYSPNHPRATKRNCYVLEHIIVMESVLGRNLLPGETVHHLNGDRADNRPENLELWLSSHPPGQRVVDLVEWAKGILMLYG